MYVLTRRNELKSRKTTKQCWDKWNVRSVRFQSVGIRLHQEHDLLFENFICLFFPFYFRNRHISNHYQPQIIWHLREDSSFTLRICFSCYLFLRVLGYVQFAFEFPALDWMCSYTGIQEIALARLFSTFVLNFTFQ